MIMYLATECPAMSSVTWPQAVMVGAIAVSAAAAVWAFFWGLK